MDSPDIAVSYSNEFSAEEFSEFVEDIRDESLKIDLWQREDSGVWGATPESYIVPALAVYFFKPYFDSFLKEMGKDHYTKLKNGLSKLINKVMKQKKEPIIVGNPAKLNEYNPYSNLISIYAQTNDGKPIKLLLPKANEDIDYSEIVDIFLEFLDKHYLGILTLKSIGYELSEYRNGHQILLSINLATKEIEWIDENKQR